MTLESAILILLPPAVVSQPEVVQGLLEEFKQVSGASNEAIHNQVLDRITQEAVKLPDSKFERVHLLGDSTTTLDSRTLELLFASMAPGAHLSGPIDLSDPLPGLMVGFEQTDDGKQLRKPDSKGVTPVAVSFKKKANGEGKKKMFQFKRLNDIHLDDDDDIIDENALLDDGDLPPTIVIPAKCDPGNGKKRRKACKDCTCGLKELEQEQIEEQQSKQASVVSLAVDETAEIDFTVPGKATGSCGSCALGDAFRCDGCPYLGLPPFKPGEVVSIADLGGDDL
ncbi:fe-S cluster assembly protein Dre2p [Trichomonascus vanleenenianus]|uniref:electron carrier DRE2 n=1 Tax=Trichomonascus vanleenenianus TaxID=2268995 RepID=UPI003ECA4072